MTFSLSSPNNLEKFFIIPMIYITRTRESVQPICEIDNFSRKHLLVFPQPDNVPSIREVRDMDKKAAVFACRLTGWVGLAVTLFLWQLYGWIGCVIGLVGSLLWFGLGRLFDR